jgi:DNA-binding transcriptional ArsR family regulator
MTTGRPAITKFPPSTLSEIELVARLFRTLGDATRLRILVLLAEEGELHQMEIVRRLKATQARVSEHMTCLGWCGFVRTRQEGRRTLYRIGDGDVLAFVGRAKSYLKRNEAELIAGGVLERAAEGAEPAPGDRRAGPARP